MSTETAGPKRPALVLPLCLLAIVLVSIGSLVFNPENRVDSLVRDLNSPSRVRRIWAVQTLGALKESSAVEALSARLQDEDPIMRRCAAWALGQINHPRSVKILTVALRHWDPNVRKEAAASLQWMGMVVPDLAGQSGSWPPLRQAMRNTPQ